MLRRLFLAVSAALLLTLSSGCTTEDVVNSALRWEQKLSRLERKTIHVGDHDIVYLEGGQGPTMVMLHGITGDSSNWVRFARHYTDRYRVIIPDLPGFGESSRIDSASYSIPVQSERLGELMRLLGVAQFHLVGNSMGGYIGAYYAAHHQQSVLSLGLFDAAGVDSPVQSTFMKELQAGNYLMLPADREDFNRILKLVMEDPPYIPGFARNVLADKALQHREFNRKVFDELKQQQLDLAPFLPNIKAPTLLLWGERDQVIDVSSIPVFQRHLTASKTTVSILPQIGHLPMLEQPAETAKRYNEFLGL
jgi:abhydrolase domain-containing protein 6